MEMINGSRVEKDKGGKGKGTEPKQTAAQLPRVLAHEPQVKHDEVQALA